MEVRWIFICPLHGMEIEVFCWRAWSDDLIYNWRKAYIETIGPSKDDQDKILEWIREGRECQIANDKSLKTFLNRLKGKET